MSRTMLIICAVLLSSSLLIFAQGTAPVAGGEAQAKQASGPVPTKFGFIETMRIVYETDEGKVEISKVQDFINKKQSEFDSKKGDLEKLSEQYQTQQRNLNPETRDEMEKTIQVKDKDMKRFQEDTQSDIDRQRDAILGKLGQKVQGLIEDYARENGYAAIFVRGQTQAFVTPSLDVTDEIIKRYNQKYPGPKQAPATK